MSITKNARGRIASAGAVLAVMSALPLTAIAQIEEVVVTTQRREESLQDVPIAVSAITSEQIERQGISDLKDVVQGQPSVQFDQSFGPADNRITIRGISNTRGRSNVAFLVDGIDVTTENLISAGSGLLANRRLLTDVERIEIVKGPQSALFGRSAFAGALSYITKEPGDEIEGRVNLDIGDYGRRNVDGAIGGPLTDTLGIRLAGVRFDEDGYYQNTISGNDFGGSDGYGGALTLVWKPADAVKIKTRFEYSDEHYAPRPTVRIRADKPFTINESAREIIRPIITGNPVTQRAASTATNLLNFGTYCVAAGTPVYTANTSNTTAQPDVITSGAEDANGLLYAKQASFCLPTLIDSSKGYQVAQSEDAETGGDFSGTDTETFRASLSATFDLGYALLSSFTGWTDFDSVDNYDQDYQASTATDINGNGQQPYATVNGLAIGRTDTLLAQQESNQTQSTYQFSQEFRIETQWDSPVKLTGGALFWQDHRTLADRNNITFCAPFGRTVNVQKLHEDPNDPNSPIVTRVDPASGATLDVFDPVTGQLRYFQGLCDGAGNTATSWQEFRRNFADPQFATQWDARTRHLSFYGRIDWNITEDLIFIAEDRFVHEEFNLLKPSSSSCTELAAVIGGNATAPWQNVPQVCDFERLLSGDAPATDGTTGNLGLRYLEGSSYSTYNTPKLTLQWNPLQDLQLYFSYAFAEKPAGINQLAGGGTADPGPDALKAERFKAEKLKAWEVGMKSAFEAAGFWQFNSSLFYQDYTDKQVSIQVVTLDGVSQPRVVNASGAEVWGFEFDTVWQPAFMEGLTLKFAGTIQDPKYTNWTDDTRNLVRVARYGDCPVVWALGDKGASDYFESTNPNDYVIQPKDQFPGVDSRDPQPVGYCRLDYSGNQLERAPKQSYSASMQVQRPFLETPFEYLVELNGSWQDERWAEAENLVKLADYALLDLRLGLVSDKWDVIAYVDNVLDDDTFKTGGSGPDFGSQVTDLGFTAGFGTTHYFATLPDPRVFGIRASYRFGAGR